MLFVKGALEAILPNCTTYEVEDGMVALTDPLRRTVLDAEATMASQGLRVLAVAYRRLGTLPERQHLEEALTFAGLVALHDPPRPEVPIAIH